MPGHTQLKASHVEIYGAGPAGLMGADVLSAAGVAITLHDHKSQPGRKFLLAGRGGLNLTHSEPLEMFLQRYGDAEARLDAAVKAFPPAAVRQWCEDLGQETFVGTSGRIFPKAMKASPLLRALLQRLGRQGVVFKQNSAWTGFSNRPTILALGGASWPETGSNALWVPVFKQAGIDVTPLRPSNSRQSVQWTEQFSLRFQGEPIKNVALTANGRTVRGEVMLTSDGIEGGAIYALSEELREPTQLTIDLKPDLSNEQVTTRLEKNRSKDSRANRLRKALSLSPQAIGLMREARSDDPKLVTISTLGPVGIQRAISTAGGVALNEVDQDFRLLQHPTTAVIGEMLDWDAPTGGYLLQACFSTAQVAAQSFLNSN